MSNILGRPVTGNISNHYRVKRVAQKGPEELLVHLDSFFEKFPFVTFVRWGQGTPVFNDGEPCTFDLHEVRFGVTDPHEEIDEDADDFDEDFGDNSFSEYSLYDYSDDDERNPDGTWKRIYKTELNGVQIAEGFYDAFRAFTSEFAHFEDLFEEKFGDPAEVTATREGFHVEYFEIGH